eukprot:762547-Hanusia_phi.AAC.1
MSGHGRALARAHVSCNIQCERRLTLWSYHETCDEMVSEHAHRSCLPRDADRAIFVVVTACQDNYDWTYPWTTD